MVSRRDELNGRAFSRRRTLAAFLQPSGGGNEQDTPRALRGLVPGLVAAALAVAGAGAYGMVRPSAPPGWQRADAVIVGSQSTTRFVMLGGVLHPVLNIASARLLLGVGSTVLPVPDSVLDSGRLPHGAVVGVPYAPDSLPTAGDAGTPKVWAYCDRPDPGGRGGDEQKLLVLGGADRAAVSGVGRLGRGQALYVQGPDGTPYLVDASGTSHVLAAGGSGAAGARRQALLITVVFGAFAGLPQPVGAAWLATLRGGDPVGFPVADMPGYGGPAGTVIDGAPTTVGETVRVRATGGRLLPYVVLRDGVHRVSGFTEQLLVAMAGRAASTVLATSVPGANTAPPFEGTRDWPQDSVTQTNTTTSGGGATVACAVYSGRIRAPGGPVLSLWAGRSYPVDSAPGTTGVYVTPGTGLLYREVTGAGADTGPVALLTDTGLRYPVPVDGGGDARARLGYSAVPPVPVPSSWASLLPRGPELSTAAAARQQPR